MDAHRVIITPAPIADPNITAEDAGRILTALAVHEISHPRYGRQTSAAVSRAFPGNPTAYRIGNLLDDVRIERRFVADYPGYTGVFDAALRYVGQGVTVTAGGKVKARMTDLLNLAILATRYPDHAEWTPATKAEAAWWTDWAERGAAVDSPKDHVEFVREALRRIAAAKVQVPPPPTEQTRPTPAPQPEPDEDDEPTESEPQDEPAPESDDEPSTDEPEATPDDAEDTQSDAAGDDDATDEDADAEQPGSSEAQEPESADDAQDAGAGEDASEAGELEAGDASEGGEGTGGEGEGDPIAGMSDDELNAATADADREAAEDARAEGEPVVTLPTCAGTEAVDKAAREQGADRKEVAELRENADELIESARNLETDGHGEMVDVARSLRGLTHGGPKRGPSEMASRYIRNAILRSRTGNTDRTPHQQRGRLDQRSLARIGLGDVRLFERRRAPSPGRYLVWVLVDASSSMDWQLPEAAQVAHAMATATNGTPTVRMAIWAWSSPFRTSQAFAGVARVWETGQNADEIFRISGLRTGGTPDAQVLGWAARAIKREARPDETPVLIVISDGEGERHMTARVEEARAMGVIVRSVSFGRGFAESAQVARFGRGNYVPFAGTITATARPLADLFAKIVSR